MLLNGDGYGAVYLTVIGSFGGLVLAILLIPYLIKIVGFVYPLVRGYIAYFLVLIVVFMILRDKFRLWALFLFLLSGTLGAVVLGIPNLKNPLFPLLSGLFGVSTLIISYMQEVKVPKQRIRKPRIRVGVAAQALTASTFAGILTSFFPGLGPAQGAVIAQAFTRGIGDKGFMILIGGVNTVNMILSLVTLFVLGKARNGSVIAISKLMEVKLTDILILVAASVVVGIICIFLALFVAKRFSYVIAKVDYRKLIAAITALIAVLSVILSGALGLLILAVSASVGMIAPLKGVSRTHAMGCLLLPVIFFLLQ